MLGKEYRKCLCSLWQKMFENEDVFGNRFFDRLTFRFLKFDF